MKTLGVLLLAGVATMAFAETNQPPQRPGLQITAGFGVFRLKENTAYYSNDVVVVDPPGKPGDPPTIIHCHELTALQGTNDNKLEKIIAHGRVTIDQGDTHARGNHGVYTSSNEWMVLTGA